MAYSKAKPAPSTLRQRYLPRDAEPNTARHQLSPEVLQPLQKEFDRVVSMWAERGTLHAERSNVDKFLTGFEALVSRSPGRLAMDRKEFQELQARYGVDDRDSLTIAQGLATVGLPRAEELVVTLSAVGHLPATLWVMGNVYGAARKDKLVLKSARTQASYQHLAEVANSEHGDLHAKCLLGRIEQLRGNEKAAIALWTDAVRLAESTKDDELPFDTRAPVHSFRDPFQLTSPWIELALIHNRRFRRGKPEADACRKALEVGCRLGDPLAHFYMASHSRVTGADGSHLATSTWLYHMNKAAMSGHSRAMFELGVFYTESGWKYLEDEPPDHVKPTAFDSYPPSQTPGWLTRIGQLLGLRPLPRFSPQESIFHSAINPSNEAQRYSLGLRWCALAMHDGYAPAALHCAKLRLEKTRWAAAEAPASAVSLTPERYTYASRADYEAKTPIAGRGSSSEAVPDKPNDRFYSKTLAAQNLARFFHAYQAFKDRTAYVANLRHEDYRQGRRPSEGRYTRMENRYVHSLPPKFRVWHLNREIRDSYEDELERMNAEAKRICDANGFIILDEDRKLMYRPKSADEANQRIYIAHTAAKDVF